MKNGKFFNSLLAAGSLFGASLLTPKINASNINDSNNAIVRSINKDSSKFMNVSLSKEESDIANSLYSLICSYCKDESSDYKLTELKYITKTIASYTVKYKINSAYDSMKNMKILKSDLPIIESYDKNDIVLSSSIRYAKNLLKNPDEMKWNFNLKSSPVLFMPKEKKLNLGNEFECKERISTDKFVFYTVNQKTDKLKMTDSKMNLSREENFLAKVIYSETSSVCTEEELKMICKVIMNRVGNADFGEWNGKRMIAAKSAYEVAKVPNAFSAVNPSRHNAPWNDFENLPNDPNVIRCKIYAKSMMEENAKSLNLIGGDDIVYYHDKSIGLPDGWINKYWLPVKVKETEHFIFYKVVKNVEKLTAKQYKMKLKNGYA